MQIKALFIGAFLAFPGLAFAGGPVTVEPEPAPVLAAPAPAYDWSGAYVGLGYGTSAADYSLGPATSPPLPASSTALTDGNSASIHAGYLLQRGALVYGGELAYSKLSDTNFPGVPDEKIDRAIDLKGKIGYSANRVLVYGILGYSQVRFSSPGDEGFTNSGPAFGLGVDVAATNRLTVGLEYLLRQTKGDLSSPDRSVEVDVDTLSLRVGFSF